MLEKREERKEKSEENKKPTIFYRKLSVLFGGDEEDRTLDLTDANRTLSQLSYAPIDAPYLTAFLQKCQGVVCKKIIGSKSPYSGHKRGRPRHSKKGKEYFLR